MSRKSFERKSLFTYFKWLNIRFFRAGKECPPESSENKNFPGKAHIYSLREKIQLTEQSIPRPVRIKTTKIF